MVISIRDAAKQFGEHLAGQGLAETTIRRQLCCITGRTGFIAACQKVKGPNPTMGQIDHSCVTAYFGAHTGTNGSRNNKLLAVRKFLQWAEKRRILRPGFTADDLLDGQKHKKNVRTPKLYVPPERFPEMLDRAGEHHPRDRAVVALVLFTLARQSEVVTMRLSDLDMDSLTAQIYRTKTRRYTETGVSPDLAEEMRAWLAWYADHTGYATPEQMIAEHPDWYLVPGGTWGRNWHVLVPDKQLFALERMFNRTLLAMGYTGFKQEGAHSGRRSGARAMFVYLRDNLGYDGALIRVQSMLDHETPQMTLRYIGMDQERDSLNDWLRSNSMYGTGKKPPQAAPRSNVVQFRQRRGA
jgi:integrase